MTPANNLVDLTLVLSERTHGKDLIELPSAQGGIFVNQDIIDISADLEDVARIGFDNNVKVAAAAMLGVMRQACVPDDDGETQDPFEAVRDWIDAWFEFEENQSEDSKKQAQA